MAQETITLIDDGRLIATQATVTGDRFRLTPQALRAALGWELKPQGLCLGDRCVPARDDATLVTADGIDLGRFARLVGRPLALDVAERTAYLGVGADERAASLASLGAPDFTLPDLEGRMHSLSGFRGKKVLLVAYASW